MFAVAVLTASGERYIKINSVLKRSHSLQGRVTEVSLTDLNWPVLLIPSLFTLKFTTDL